MKMKSVSKKAINMRPFSGPLLDEWVSTTPFGTNFFARAFDQLDTPGAVVRGNAIL